MPSVDTLHHHLHRAEDGATFRGIGARHSHTAAARVPPTTCPTRTRRHKAAAGGGEGVRPDVVAAGDATAQHLLLGSIVPARPCKRHSAKD